MELVTFLLGFAIAVVVCVIFVGAAATVAVSREINAEHKDDWWRRGDPPPWQVNDDNN